MSNTLDDDSDSNFLDYVRAHSRTDRALFSDRHVARLLQLAGDDRAPIYAARSGFTSIDEWTAKPLIDAARARLSP